MHHSLKELTIKYLESLSSDIIFRTSKKNWSREDLLNEVKAETEIGKEVIKINTTYILS